MSVKSWSKWLLAVLALALCALLLPFPRKASTRLDGLAYAGDGSVQACTIEADAVRMSYLLRADRFKGALSLSTDARTQGARFEAEAVRGAKGSSGEYFMMLGYAADGTPFCSGLFIAPADLSWIYVQNWLEDGTLCELMAPAAGEEDAQAIRERARTYCGLLPNT